MTADMRNKLMGYRQSLEFRYGDPAAYAAQRQQMALDTATAAYNNAKTREEALNSTYNKKRDVIREAHAERLSKRRASPSTHLAPPTAVHPFDPTTEQPQPAPPA